MGLAGRSGKADAEPPGVSGMMAPENLLARILIENGSILGFGLSGMMSQRSAVMT